MSRVQPQTLSDEELLNHIYKHDYNVSVDFVRELWQRYEALLNAVEDDLK